MEQTIEYGSQESTSNFLFNYLKIEKRQRNKKLVPVV